MMPTFLIQRKGIAPNFSLAGEPHHRARRIFPSEELGCVSHNFKQTRGVVKDAKKQIGGKGARILGTSRITKTFPGNIPIERTNPGIHSIIFFISYYHIDRILERRTVKAMVALQGIIRGEKRT